MTGSILALVDPPVFSERVVVDLQKAFTDKLMVIAENYNLNAVQMRQLCDYALDAGGNSVYVSGQFLDHVLDILDIVFN